LQINCRSHKIDYCAAFYKKYITLALLKEKHKLWSIVDKQKYTAIILHKEAVKLILHNIYNILTGIIMNALQETTESVMTNRRNFIRAKIAVKMCGFFFEEGDAGERAYNGCFMSKTIDMSEGGMQIIHNGSLKPGMVVELRTKNAIGFPKCLKCDQYYNMRSKIELAPLTARVVWTQGSRCGLEFVKLSNLNRNVIAKIVWKKHIEEIKSSKETKQ